MKILYVCKSNISRSQMAEALHKDKYPKDEVKSAGITTDESTRNKTLEELERLDKCHGVIPSMKEIGYDISKHKHEQLTQKMVEEADKVIVMCNKEYWPDYLKQSSKVVYWEVEDPGGKSLEKFREARNEIKKRILKLKARN